MQGTYGLPDSPAAEWLEYEFKCKPGNVSRVPCLISPYHYRLDWLMWFSAFQVFSQFTDIFIRKPMHSPS